MRIAYFVNKYPAVSHSFIRREILELERQGIRVARYAIYCEADTLRDAQDKDECSRTRYIKSQPAWRLAWLILQTVVFRLPAFLSALQMALVQGHRSAAGIGKHLLYLLEGCVLAHWCRTDGIRHVHAHFGTNSAAIAQFASRISGIGYSFTVHGPDEFDNPRGLRLREKIRHARFVVAISSYGRSQLMRWADYADWKRIQVVHCGLDKHFLEAVPHDVEPKPGASVIPELVCVGRLSAQKGQLLLVEAMAELRRRAVDVRLVLAGDGEMRRDIEALIRKHDLQDAITITGWIDSQTVLERLEAATALILPSFAEGLPVVIMEAFARRKPVLTTYVAGIPELVKDGVNGLLFPAGSVAAIADAVETLLALPAERLHAMGEAGHAAVCQRHDIVKEMNRLRRHFEQATHD